GGGPGGAGGLGTGARQRCPAPLRGGRAGGDPRGRSARARSEPAGRSDAAEGGEGARGARGSRPHAAGRRPGARRGRAHASPPARPGGGGLHARRCDPSCDRSRPRAMRQALGAATLGAAMLIGALAFGASSLYLPAVALLLLAGGAAAWVALAVAGASIERTGGPPTVEEERAWPLRLEVRAGIVRPP